MRRGYLLALLATFFVIAAPFPASAAEKLIGQSCTGDNAALDWDTIAQCTGSTFARAPIFWSGGNVGIGTTSPLFNGLDVDTSSSGSSSWQAGIMIRNHYGASTASSAIHFGNDSANDIGEINAGSTNYGFYGGPNSFNIIAYSSPLTFSVSNAEKMRITSSGYVGIGTTSPSTPLQVNGTITAPTLTGLSSPVNGSDAANKAYVDSHAGGGGTWHTQTFTSNGTWTNPGVNSVQVVLSGGGGGGGGGGFCNPYGTTYYTGGGGGGGGALVYLPNLPVTGNLSIAIGGGGSGGYGYNTQCGNSLGCGGNGGGTTTVSGGVFSISAAGGGGGGTNNGYGYINPGGGGGSGNTSGAFVLQGGGGGGGGFNGYPGGGGSPSASIFTGIGGGGAGGGSGAGGAGGGGSWGSGAAGANNYYNNGASAAAGSGAGGGGGGAPDGNPNAGNGGNGGSGMAMIIWLQ